MEILDSSVTGGSESNILTNTMREYLRETAKWGKFLSVVGFIGVGFIVVLAFSIGTIIGMLPMMEMGQTSMFAGMGTLFTGIYLVFAVLWFFPVWYLFKFSTGILKSLSSMDITGIENALSNLKSLFKYYGVFTLIFLSFYGIIILFALIGIAAR